MPIRLSVVPPEQVRNRKDRRWAPVSVSLALLIALPTLLPQTAATSHSAAWVLTDPEGDLRLPTGSGVGLAKDGADLRALTLQRTSANNVNVTITLTNLYPPYPSLPSPTSQQVRHILRFSTPEWKVIADVTVTAGDVPSAYVEVFVMNDYAALWFGFPADIDGSDIKFSLGGFFDGGTWSGIWIESIAEVCKTPGPCLNGVYSDRAPNVGTAPDFT